MIDLASEHMQCQNPSSVITFEQRSDLRMYLCPGTLSIGNPVESSNAKHTIQQQIVCSIPPFVIK